MQKCDVTQRMCERIDNDIGERDGGGGGWWCYLGVNNGKGIRKKSSYSSVHRVIQTYAQSRNVGLKNPDPFYFMVVNNKYFN